MLVLFERSMANLELATLMELRDKSAWCLFHKVGWFSSHRLMGHFICFPFE